MVLVLSASMVSGAAGVSNEMLLKKRDTDVGLWRKNMWTYQWGVIFNLIGLFFRAFFGTSSGDDVEEASSADNLFAAVFRGFDFWVWFMIIITGMLGISV